MANAGNIPPAVNGAPPLPMDEQGRVRLQKAVREFESLFVGYMLKSMRSSLSSEEMFGDSFGGDVMEGMFDLELARQISRNSSFGIGEMLYRKMTGEALPPAVPHSSPRQQAAERSVAPPGPPPAPAGGAAQPAERETPRAGAPEIREETRETGPAPPRRPEGRIDRRLVPFEPIIREAAERHNIDPNLLKAVIASESAGNAQAHSSKNAKGLMQLIDTTAADMGVQNVWDPRQNVHGGARYLQQLLERFDGNLEQAIASYNAGPGAVEKHGGIPPYRETKSYVNKVLSFLQYFTQQEGGHNDHE